MLELDDQQQAARTWFEALRDRICDAFETIEAEAGSDARFDYLSWDRHDPDGAPGGGGVRGVMKGKVFEKVGVNVSTVGGRFSEEFAKTIHGAGEDPSFFATVEIDCPLLSSTSASCSLLTICSAVYRLLVSPIVLPLPWVQSPRD